MSSTSTRRPSGLEKGSAIYRTRCPGRVLRNHRPSRLRHPRTLKDSDVCGRRSRYRFVFVRCRSPSSKVVWGATLQYSLPYLKANVVDLGLPDFVNHLIRWWEASLVTPVNNTFGRMPTTGTINPGVIWVGQKVQFGLEALIPVNRQSGRHVGVLGQMHFYLDDIFPDTIGRPIF